MEHLTLRETAAELRLGATKTWQLTATGELPTIRIGRRVLVSRADLDAFLAVHRGGGNDIAAQSDTPGAKLRVRSSGHPRSA